jgi:hypothetical protein
MEFQICKEKNCDNCNNPDFDKCEEFQKRILDTLDEQNRSEHSSAHIGYLYHVIGLDKRD